MSEFVKVDIAKLESFVKESEEAITEFADIRTEFERINKTLLKNWKGAGAYTYEEMSKHIADNIGGIKDVLDTINGCVVKDLIEHYNKLDQELANYNLTAGEPEKGNQNV